MHHVREVLRLKFVGGVPTREIARRIGVAASTVRTTIKRFQAAGLSWPLPEELTDTALEARLFADIGTKQGHRRQVEPDWASIHRELKRKHVTLSILWDEYIEHNPQGYRYSRFCELYRRWEAKLSLTMRQTHVGGDKLFVDYAGDTVPVIVDGTQTLGDWIAAHTRAFAAIGGVPRLIVPDNAKVAVIKACHIRAAGQPKYAEMAAHYGTAVLPTRPRRPRDKAKVEAAVLVVERWILARLRHRRFYSLAELNAAIGALMLALGRLTVNKGYDSRYAVVASLFWCALLTLMLIRQSRSRAWRTSLLFGLITLVIGAVPAKRYEDMFRMREQNMYSQAVLATLRFWPELPHLNALYPDPEILFRSWPRPRTPFPSFAQREPFGWIGARLTDLQPTPQSSRCFGYVDAVSKTGGGASGAQSSGGAPRVFTVTGWAVIVAPQSHLRWIVISDETNVGIGAGKTGLPRPDVVAHLAAKGINVDDQGLSGFQISRTARRDLGRRYSRSRLPTRRRFPLNWSRNGSTTKEPNTKEPSAVWA